MKKLITVLFFLFIITRISTAQEDTTAAVKVIAPCDAKDYVGQTVTVKGTIDHLSLSKSGILFLNFGEMFPNNCFTIAFRDGEKYKDTYKEGAEITITGTIESYKDKPEIMVKE